MAQRLDTNADFIMALSAHESGWLGTHSQQLYNLFGVTHGAPTTTPGIRIMIRT
jgi:flagellum-specific peptidoglycan hydrolase FlgJ